MSVLRLRILCQFNPLCQPFLGVSAMRLWVAANSILTCGEAFTGKGWSREKSRRGCSDGERGRNGRIGLAVVFSDGCRNEKTAGHCIPPAISFVCSLSRNYLKTNKDTLSWYKFRSCSFEFADLLSDLSMFARKDRKVKTKSEKWFISKTSQIKYQWFILLMILTL